MTRKEEIDGILHSLTVDLGNWIKDPGYTLDCHGIQAIKTMYKYVLEYEDIEKERRRGILKDD